MVTVDEAGKEMWDDTDRCECGHDISWHDEEERCRFEYCQCRRFNYEDEDFDDMGADE